jgi:Holliday junction resolvase RusA-like endonuclease
LDLDKLIRAILDGITNVLIPDDTQVVSITAGNGYAEPDKASGLKITVISVVN